MVMFVDTEGESLIKTRFDGEPAWDARIIECEGFSESAPKFDVFLDIPEFLTNGQDVYDSEYGYLMLNLADLIDEYLASTVNNIGAYRALPDMSKMFKQYANKADKLYDDKVCKFLK